MGDIIDRKKEDDNYRCKNVKVVIVWISLILTPISFSFLIFSVIRMLLNKKKLTFLTNLILLIFFSEMMNNISKLIQPIKYAFDDDRDVKDISIIDMDNARGVICQIQIVTSIFSDYCSLLTTLLLSLRCYDVIRNKERFFDKGKNAILSIVFVILISIIFSIGFLFLDRYISRNNVSYRFDVRDRCSYWCWLEHISSFICFIIYMIILILNIIYAYKTNSFLKMGYKKLLEESQVLSKSSDNMNTPLNDIQKGNDSKNSSESLSNNKYNNLTKEEIKRIDELRYMKLKCFIYPLITICIWLFATTYRISDVILMWDFDQGNNPQQGEDDEKIFFQAHPILHFFTRFFLVLHVFLSSIRGIFYGFSFIIFEEKIFYNFFRKIFKKSDLFDDNEDNEKRIERNTNDSCSAMNEESENKSRSEKDEENDKEDLNSNSRNDNIEMNTSDYRYNDNN